MTSKALARYRDGLAITREMPAITMHDLVHEKENAMAKKKSDVVDAATATATATATTKDKRPTIDEQLAAVTARAESGDTDAANLLPALSVYAEQITQARSDLKRAAKKLRKLLSTLKD